LSDFALEVLSGIWSGKALGVVRKTASNVERAGQLVEFETAPWTAGASLATYRLGSID
jgi:methylthioribose-1-phosphate isomerase